MYSIYFMKQWLHPDPSFILNNAKDVQKYIKGSDIKISEELSEVLDILTNTQEHEINKKVKTTNEIYNEYLVLLRQKRLKEHANKNAPISSEFIERYKREQKIWKLLNNYYYNSPDWGFSLWWLNTFYDEWNTIFANNVRDSKIFSFDGNSIHQIWKQYYQIRRLWNYYIGVQVETTTVWDRQILLENSQTYFVLDKSGHEVRKLQSWHISYRSSYGIYVETYKDKEEDNNMQTYYNEDMEVIADRVPENNIILMAKGNQILFKDQNHPHLMFIVEQWKEWNKQYYSVEELKNEDIYKEYDEKINYQALVDKRQNVLNETIESKYNILWKWWNNSLIIDKITDQWWNAIFLPEEGYKYFCRYPHVTKSSHIVTKATEQSDINEWYFVLEKVDWNNNFDKEVFINSHSWLVVEFDNPMKQPATLIQGKLIVHFINQDESEVYSLEWKKLGKQHKEDHRYGHNYALCISHETGKKQLISCKTWETLPQEFDKPLKYYNYDDKEVAIVENDGNILSIEVEK